MFKRRIVTLFVGSWCSFMFIRTKYESLHSVIRQLNVFVLLSSPDKWKHCGVWRSASLCSVYYPPERLSSSCFPRFPSPSSFLSLSRSLRTLKGLHEFQSDSISASKLLHLFSRLTEENLIFFVWAALLASSRFPSVASSLSSHFQRLFNFDFHCLLLFRAAFLYKLHSTVDGFSLKLAAIFFLLFSHPPTEWDKYNIQIISC